MLQSVLKLKNDLKGKLLLMACAVAGAVALPHLIHVIGAISGVGTSLGEVLLPMHFFVLLAGLLAGPAVGAATGAFAPLVSSLLSGMPHATVLPFMMIELIGYGLVAGLLSESKMNSFCKLLIAQIGGRALRAVAVLISVYGLEWQAVGVASIWQSLSMGLFGILLQWIVLPLLLYRIQSAEKEI